MPQGFEHCFQSVRIVEKLERNGEGLNLTKEVRDGILNHRTSGMPSTLEGKVVRLSDKIAYVNHDIDDAITAKILKERHNLGKDEDLIMFKIEYKYPGLKIPIIEYQIFNKNGMRKLNLYHW